VLVLAVQQMIDMFIPYLHLKQQWDEGKVEVNELEAYYKPQ
jgi:hypothetical protein